MDERAICGETAVSPAGGAGALGSALFAWLHGSTTSPGFGAQVGFAGGGFVHGSTVSGKTGGGHFRGAHPWAASPVHAEAMGASAAALWLGHGDDVFTRLSAADADEAVAAVAVAIAMAGGTSGPPHGSTCCCATDTDPSNSTPTTPMMIEERPKNLQHSAA